VNIFLLLVPAPCKARLPNLPPLDIAVTFVIFPCRLEAPSEQFFPFRIKSPLFSDPASRPPVLDVTGGPPNSANARPFLFPSPCKPVQGSQPTRFSPSKFKPLFFILGRLSAFFASPTKRRSPMPFAFFLLQDRKPLVAVFLLELEDFCSIVPLPAAFRVPSGLYQHLFCGA